MFIEIKDLEENPLDFYEELAPGAIDLGPDLVQTRNLQATGRAQLVEEHHGKHQKIKDIRIAGKLFTALHLICARCLEPVGHNISHDFDLLYRPLGADSGREELSVTAAEAEVGYYHGDGIFLEDVVREQVLLCVPLKVICRDDCKGLCSSCGSNLNDQQCSCGEPLTDLRWTALKDIRSKL